MPGPVLRYGASRVATSNFQSFVGDYDGVALFTPSLRISSKASTAIIRYVVDTFAWRILRIVCELPANRRRLEGSKAGRWQCISPSPGYGVTDLIQTIARLPCSYSQSIHGEYSSRSQNNDRTKIAANRRNEVKMLFPVARLCFVYQAMVPHHISIPGNPESPPMISHPSIPSLRCELLPSEATQS